MANEKRLIDANVFKSFLCKCCNILRSDEPCEPNDCNVWAVIDEQPTVDAVEVVHGRWEDVKETSLYVPDMKYTVTHTAETCSVCKVRIGFIGGKLYLYDNICPNCGAKMDLEV